MTTFRLLRFNKYNDMLVSVIKGIHKWNQYIFFIFKNKEKTKRPNKKERKIFFK